MAHTCCHPLEELDQSKPSTQQKQAEANRLFLSPHSIRDLGSPTPGSCVCEGFGYQIEGLADNWQGRPKARRQVGLRNPESQRYARLTKPRFTLQEKRHKHLRRKSLKHQELSKALEKHLRQRTQGTVCHSSDAQADHRTGSTKSLSATPPSPGVRPHCHSALSLVSDTSHGFSHDVDRNPNIQTFLDCSKD